ncbi:MAG: DUF6644 family protein [Hyphomonas sp.]
MRDFVAWLSETPLSIALRESFVLWPALEAAHVMSIMLFAGTIFMVDLRLLGVVFRKVPFSEMDKRILPLTVAGFILLVITGLILVYSKPLVYYYSAFFRFKLVVIGLAMINIGVFHKMVQKGQAEWDTDEKAPRAGQISAIISLASWIIVIILGRMIAYDWLQCEKLEPGSFMHTFTHCKPLEVVDLDHGINLAEIR